MIPAAHRHLFPKSDDMMGMGIAAWFVFQQPVLELTAVRIHVTRQNSHQE